MKIDWKGTKIIFVGAGIVGVLLVGNTVLFAIEKNQPCWWYSAGTNPRCEKETLKARNRHDVMVAMFDQEGCDHPTPPNPDMPDFSALNRKDLQTALKIWQPLAEKGNAPAEAGMGALYESGDGVKQDYAKAFI